MNALSIPFDDATREIWVRRRRVFPLPPALRQHDRYSPNVGLCSSLAMVTIFRLSKRSVSEEEEVEEQDASRDGPDFCESFTSLAFGAQTLIRGARNGALGFRKIYRSCWEKLSRQKSFEGDRVSERTSEKED